MADKKKKKAKKVEAKVVSAEIVPDDETSVSSSAASSQKELSPAGSQAVAPVDSKALTPADPVAIYLNEIKKYPLLSREEEHELAVRYRETGDPEAAEQLVTANLRFVVKVAAEYSKFGSKLIDLVQEGNVGLMHAVKEFNPYKGVRLITYAVWWIRGYIQDYLMKQHSMVKIGTTQNQRKLFYQLQKEKNKLDEMGEQPNFAQLSERLGIPENEIIEMEQRMNNRDLSLDYTVGEESGTTLLDFQADGEDTPDLQLGNMEELEILKEKINELRPELNERELELLDERVLADPPLKLQEIGERHGVSREAVRQMENRLMKKIKDKLTEALSPSDFE